MSWLQNLKVIVAKLESVLTVQGHKSITERLESITWKQNLKAKLESVLTVQGRKSITERLKSITNGSGTLKV